MVIYDNHESPRIFTTHLDFAQNSFGKNLKYWAKVEIFVKNRNYGQKSKDWSKVEIFVKNRNYGQKSKYWSKVEIFAKIFVKT